MLNRTRRALKGPKGPTRWALKGPKGPNVEAGGPLRAPKAHMSVVGKIKTNAPTSPGWIWAKNMGLGTFGVINWQKFQPSGLKMRNNILTRSR